jgi:ABC-2 type transport system permease protein
MRNILTIALKELRGYFVSPVAYVVGFGYLLIMGFLFSVILINSRSADLRGVFSNMGVILLLIAPVLSMRLLSEEYRTGTVELLLTFPVREYEVVVGKFLGAMAFFLAMLAPTLYYAFILFVYGNPDFGPIVSGYVGAILLAMAFLSAGMLTSAATQNQIVAAVLGFGLTVLLWLFGSLSAIFPSRVSDVASYLGVIDHYFDFSRGVIDTRNVVYFLSLTIFFLFATTRVVEAKRLK